MSLPLKRIPFLFFLLFSCFFLGCNKTPVEKPDPIIFPAVDMVPTFDKELATASVQGFVVLADGSPVAGASVNAGTNITITDAKGYFGFHNIQLSKNNGFIKVIKPGYFTGSRSFLTNSNRNNQVRIQLIPKQTNGTINPAAGGSVSLPNGMTVILPVNAVIKASDSSAYTGTINVALAWIDPTSTKLAEQMPGDLRGITTAGNENVLESFGMAAVELTGADGELLQITPGKKATLSFVIPASLSAAAPATIPLWYFNESIGRWKQAGTATKTGDKYIGEVSHFSFWNLDIPVPLVNYSTTIVSTSGELMSYTSVVFINASKTMGALGITDSVGYLSLKLPANEVLDMGIVSPCSGVLISQQTGPFASNTIVDTTKLVTIPNSFFVTISGKITDCNNNGISNGTARINIVGGGTYSANTDSSGNFNAIISNCTSSSEFSVQPIDNSNLLSFQPIHKVLHTINDMGNISTCLDTTNYINIQVHDTVINMPLTYYLSTNNGYVETPTPFGASPFSETDTVSTTIYGGFTSVGSSRFISFSFRHLGNQAGTYPITSYSSSYIYMPKFSLQGVIQTIPDITINTPPTLTITKPFTNIGDYIEGSFSMIVIDQATFNPITGGREPLPLICNFRIKRTN
jgi:hypothetical protein